MANLATAISAAITKSLLAKLPTEASSKFNVDETEFKEFLQEFLSSQLKAGAKSGRSAGPKGKNGKGRISGYILFSNANRDSVKEDNPDLKFTDVGKRLGEMWGELSDKAKADWNAKAVKQNEANGLPTPTPTPAKRTPAKKSQAKATDNTMKISRHKESNSWVVQGTTFVVQSPKNKVVTGKLRGNNVVALTAADRKKCADNGWEVQAAKAKAKAAPKKAAPSKRVESDNSGDEDSE